MNPIPKTRMTEAEYIAHERKAEFKSEFYRGEMFAMSGASRQHVRISGNLNAEARLALKGRPCAAYQSDLRVRVSATGLYTYPDVVIVCGEEVFLDKEVDTLLNPTVLAEVLSKSTETYDRGIKSAHYRTIESLQEYLLISQDEPHVELYTRKTNDTWLFRELKNLEDTLHLTSVDMSIPLVEIYRGIEFPAKEFDPTRH